MDFYIIYWEDCVQNNLLRVQSSVKIDKIFLTLVDFMKK